MKKKKMSGGAEIGDLEDEGSLELDSLLKVRIYAYLSLIMFRFVKLKA